MRKPTSFKLNPHIKREIVFGSGSSVEAFRQMPDDPTGPMLISGGGQSNFQGQSFAETGTGFTEIINSTKVKMIRGINAPLTTYNNPRSLSYNGTGSPGPQLNNGDFVIENQTLLTWSTPNDADLLNKLVDLIVTNKSNVSEVAIQPGAIGGSSIGSHINSALYDGNAGYMAQGGLLQCKKRALQYHFENHETGGVEPDYDWKCYIWWQGESEFLKLARGQENRAYVDNARDALHQWFTDNGIYDDFDAIIEIQPVYIDDFGYFDNTDLATWQSEYAYIKSSYKAKAEAMPKTRWLDIQDVIDNSDYQLASNHGAGGFHRSLHINMLGQYQVGQLVYNLATGA